MQARIKWPAIIQHLSIRRGGQQRKKPTQCNTKKCNEHEADSRGWNVHVRSQMGLHVDGLIISGYQIHHIAHDDFIYRPLVCETKEKRRCANKWRDKKAQRRPVTSWLPQRRRKGRVRSFSGAYFPAIYLKPFIEFPQSESRSNASVSVNSPSVLDAAGLRAGPSGSTCRGYDRGLIAVTCRGWRGPNLSP
jgi:hypothetical protein